MRAALTLVLVSILAPLASAAPYPQGPPNDPSFAPAEAPGDDVCREVAVNDEQHYLYSFMPRCAPNATDPENASGMSVDRAWAEFTTGDPDVLVAYVEGGINWHDGDVRDLVDQIWLNVRELPLPRDASGHAAATHDLDGDGVARSKDYARDARVADANANGVIDAEDLIVAFSNGVDEDANGFVDDISGWDFYDHQNDPATVDATYGHANGQMRQMAAATNNGFMGAGVCPDCRILPIKAGAEALDRTDDLAQAWLYAADAGADVIVSVTADLGYSSFMAQVVDRLWRRGVVMVEASNDFDSTDHQGGMFWPHVVPGNGLVTNTRGFPESASANAATTTFRVRSGLTSWGTHAMFSVATQGGSTSTSVPTTGGVLALILSEGRKLSPPLTGPEAIQVAIATASDVDDPALPWPGKPGWDLQYGYGRPNVHRAAEAVSRGNVPPLASIESPSWYALYDPTVATHVPIEGRMEAPRSSSYSWRVEWALGAEPEDADWRVAGHGRGASPFEGRLGAIDLSEVPESFWSAPMEMSDTKALEATEKFTVSIRLTVTDAHGREGVDRRSIAVHRDEDWKRGFPLRIGPSLESAPALARLQGLPRDAIVFADTDGRVHAIDAVHRAELPGWPALLDATRTDGPTHGLDAGREPVVAPVSVADITGDGKPEVVVASSTGSVYVFDERGHRLPGWPKTPDAFAVTPAIPRPALQFTRLAHRGLTASPVLHDLDGDGVRDIVQASWDGGVYAWRADGSSIAGWPVRVRLPADHPVPPGQVRIDDQKIVTTPAVADLDGDGAAEIVVQSQITEVPGGGIQPRGVMHVFAYRADGTSVPGWPVEVAGLVEYYGSGQEFITEGSTAPVAADVDGDGRDEVAVSPVLSPSVLLDGSGLVRTVYGPAPNVAAEILALNVAPDAWADGNLPTDAPITFTTTGAFGRIAGTLAYAQPGTGGASMAGALLFAGSGLGIKSYERAYDAATGATLPGFPALLQGLNFLGAPILADVTGDGVVEVIDGGDSSTLHAFTAAGTQAPGFPKFHTGWTVFSPAAGDVDGDGLVEIVVGTREGYLFVWDTSGEATAIEWGSYHAGAARTGRYEETLPLPQEGGGALPMLAIGVAGLALAGRRRA